MDRDAPDISIVIAARDREETIPATIESLLAQSHERWEAIVVDDGSKDGTAALVARQAERDPRFRLERQANTGVSGARNAGIGLARAPWLMFLDADDWIAPDALERLFAATRRRPEPDAAYGGYVRIGVDGAEIRDERHPHDDDLFPLFARTCAFVIHACLVRTRLVRAAGGFDPGLVTCEDWDLWQRIARSGARFAAVPGDVAYYRMRPGSASGDPRRMLEDSFAVIARGHGGTGVERLGPSTSPRLSQAYSACYAAGLAIARGADPVALLTALDGLDGVRGLRLEPSGVAGTIFEAVAIGLAVSRARWATFGREVFEAVGAFAEALGERVEDNWLAFGVREELDRLVIAASDAARPATVGRWHLIDLDVARDAPPTVELPDAVDRVSCDVRWDGELLGTVEIGAADGRLPAPVVADAVAAALAWPLLRRILERDALADVDVERSGSRLRVSRRGRLLADDEQDAGRALGDWLHDHVGWSLLLGELFAEPGMSSDDFFATARRTPRRGSAVEADGHPVAVELTEPLPALSGSGTGAAVAVTLAGVPLTAVRVPLVDGRLTAHDLRRIVLEQTGFELAVAAVREWLLAAAHDPGGGLRPRLRALRAARRSSRSDAAGSLAPGWETAAAEALGAGGGTLLGRAPAAPEGTAASRYAVLPAGARDALVAAAEAAGEAVVARPGDATARTVHVPWAFAPGAAVRRLGDLSAMAAAEFEQLFATQADPWGYESGYERRKYAQTLSLVPEGVGRALELGCAEGHFTQRLAPRVGELTATDISAVALTRAAERCRAADNLAFEQLDLFAADLPGGNDLVVVSEILYYLPDPTRLREIAAKLAGAVAPGGHLLTAHARAVVDGGGPGFDWDVPFGADSIDRALRRHGRLVPVREIETPAYRIQLLRRDGGRRRVLRRRGERRREDAGEMTSEAAAGFLPDGGDVRRGDGPEPVAAERLPILMYHQIAADGPERSARWRLHPDAFEEQLAWLRDNGFHSLSFAQWRAAVSARRAVPGRPVMLTFDDGYADFHTVAAPLLRRHGFSATVFLVTDRVGDANRWDAELGEPLRLMGWDQVAELAGQGFEFGSHSATHRPLVSLSPEEAVRDLARSRLALTERLGRPPAALCYPYGLVDPVLAQRAGGAGFQYGVTTEERSAWPTDPLLRLPRHEVRGGDPLRRFIAQVTS